MPTVTPNMSLTAWDALGDFFSHTDLANNFDAIDEHDHTTGKGVQIPTAGLANASVTNTKLAADSVTADKIADTDLGAVVIASNLASIPSFSDTQGAGITASGILTDISITPGAGTYAAFATAQGTSTTTTVAVFELSLRVNGVNVVTGPPQATSGVSSKNFCGMSVCGLITPGAVEAVQVHGSIAVAGGGTDTISEGILILARLA